MHGPYLDPDSNKTTLKNYYIYEAIGNLNTDWTVYYIKRLLLILRCDYYIGL